MKLPKPFASVLSSLVAHAPGGAGKTSVPAGAPQGLKPRIEPAPLRQVDRATWFLSWTIRLY
jgi:hypothetical protein